MGIDAFTMPAEELLQIAASVESGTNHPIANAIVSYAMTRCAAFTGKDSEYLRVLALNRLFRDDRWS